jgi:uncharacterized protein CbrC (UPF0167 family)
MRAQRSTDNGHKPKGKRWTFLVRVPGVEGVSQEAWCDYIEDAIKSWGSLGKSEPITVTEQRK